ncbi:MAG: ABC transporter substrate-binding protein, partial [Chloroflexi bacterium]|nr:ABC transporter substrate-binding protein [Chloroflexota bacterium]
PKPAPAPTPAGPSGELRVALFSLGRERFDPIVAGSTDALQILSPLYDLLLRGEAGKIQPGIAEKWELGPDGKSWVFYIRKGVKFHNGEDLTADDVVFTLGRYISDRAELPDTRRALERVEKVDDYTVRAFTRGQQPFYPYIVAPFARALGFVQPKDYIEQRGVEYFERRPIGSGSFKFVRFVIGDVIEYEAFDTHWRQVPGFKKLTVLKIPEESTRLAMLKTGQVDLADVSTEASLELETAGFRVQPTIAEQAAVLLPGTYQPEGAKFPTSDLRVRQALSLAINREEIRKSLFYGKALPVGPFPVHAVSADIDIPFWMDYAEKIFRYDPEEAKKLLKEAGYPNGFTMKLWQINWPGAAYMPKLAEVIQGYWGKIGVKAEIGTVDMTVYPTNRNTLKVPEWIGSGFTMATSANPAVPERINSHFHSTTHTPLFGKAMPEVDKMIESAFTELDTAKRKEIEDKLIKTIADSYVALMIARVPTLYALGARVDIAFPPPPTAAPIGYYLDIAKPRK